MERKRTDEDPQPKQGAGKSEQEESGFADISTSASLDEEQQSERQITQTFSDGAATAVYTVPKPGPILRDSVRQSHGGTTFTLDSPNSDSSDHVPTLDPYQREYSAEEHDSPSESFVTGQRPRSQVVNSPQSPGHSGPPYARPFQDTVGIRMTNSGQQDIDPAATNRHAVQETQPHEPQSEAHPVVLGRKPSSDSLLSAAEPGDHLDEAVKKTKSDFVRLKKELAEESHRADREMQRANREAERAETEAQKGEVLEEQLEKNSREKKQVEQRLHDKQKELEEVTQAKDAEISRLNGEIGRLTSELSDKEKENHHQKEKYEAEIKELQKKLKETEYKSQVEILRLTNEKHVLELTIKNMEKEEEKMKRQIAEERAQQAWLIAKYEKKDREKAEQEVKEQRTEKERERAEKEREQAERVKERRESLSQIEKLEGELAKARSQLQLKDLGEQPDTS